VLKTIAGIPTRPRRSWTRGAVASGLLINEKIYRKQRFGLKLPASSKEGTMSKNDPDDWVRADAAFSGILCRKICSNAAPSDHELSALKSSQMTKMLEALARILKPELAHFRLDNQRKPRIASTSLQDKVGSLL